MDMFSIVLIFTAFIVGTAGLLTNRLELTFLTTVVFCGVYYLHLKGEQDERHESLDSQMAEYSEETPRRAATSGELERFGADAKQGIVFGGSKDVSRLFCIRYFDGEVGSFQAYELQGSQKNRPVDARHCKKLHAFSKHTESEDS